MRDSFNITVDRTTGIADSSLENSDIRIFPNPSDGVFSIELPHPQFYKIELLDVLGNIVVTKVLHVDDFNQRIRLDVADFQIRSGLYLLLANDGQTQFVKKVIINRSH